MPIKTVRLAGVWYNPKKNELIEISEWGGIYFNCCIMDRFQCSYYNTDVQTLKANNWVRICDL